VSEDALEEHSFEDLWGQFEHKSRGTRRFASVARLKGRRRALALVVGVLVMAASAAAAVSLSGGRAIPVRLPGGKACAPPDSDTRPMRT